MSVGSNSDTGSSRAQDLIQSSSEIEGQDTSLVEGNPWFPLCASRLSVLNNPKIPLTEVKAKFEQELRWIEETKSVIKSRLNMLCPIARLSPEVLAHVFRLLTDIEWPFHPSKEAPDIGWMRVTHVCRSWRNIALDYPDLWGRGDICSLPGWTDERLRWSKEVPFDVMIHLGEPIPPAVVANVHRVRNVGFHWGIIKSSDGDGDMDMDMDMDASHRALLTSSAPSLLSFSYRCIPCFGKYLKLPYNIFACNAPRLTHLFLQNTTLTFHPSIFENLVHLYLNYRDFTIPGTFDVDIPLNRNQLPELLLQIPKLETLMLGGKIDKSLEDTESQSDVDDHQRGPALSAAVPLPQLKHLALGGDPWSWLWLAEQLSIPATASFWLECRMVAVQDQARVCDAFLPFMIRHLMEKSYSRSTQSLRVMCRSRDWRLTMLTGWIDDLRNADPPTWPAWEFPENMAQTVSAPIDFKFSNFVGPVIPVVQVLRPLLAKIHTNNIRHLKVCGTASHLDCIEWLKLFASFTSLEHLSIDGMVAFNLMQALGLDLTLNLWPSSVLGHTSSPGEQVLFPNLRTLEFYRVDFTCFVSAADALLSDITTTALTERREMNRTLEEISVTGCCFRRRWVDGLRNVGLRVSGAPFESGRNDDFGLIHPSRKPSPSPFPLYD